MKSVLTKISAIKRNPNNPRILKDDKFAKLTQSIKDFPQMLDIRPIVVNDDMIVLGGNMRLKACKEAGLSEVPVIKVDDLTEEQQREFIIKDNVGFGEWDWDLLANEWDTDLLEDWGLELDFNPEDDDNAGLTDEDDTPELTENPVSKVGDIWLLGEHRVMCGDSTELKSVESLTKDIDLDSDTAHCISDPPYGIAYDPKNDRYGMIKNDDTFLDYIGLAKKFTNGFFFMWTSYQVVDEWIGRVKEEFEKINNMIIWHKGGGGMGDCARTLATDFEIALVVNRGNEIQGHRDGAAWDYQKNKRKEFLNKAKKSQLVEILDRIIDGDVLWKIKKDNTSSYMHPTQKPVEVNQKALTHFTSRGDYVVDLFLGSGSNLIACETMGRKCYGMELDPKYVDVIIKRWQEYTGKKAIHAESGEQFMEG